MTEPKTVREWLLSHKNWCDHGQIWKNSDIERFAKALLEFVRGKIEGDSGFECEHSYHGGAYDKDGIKEIFDELSEGL